MDRKTKAFTGKNTLFASFQFSSKEAPHRKPCVQKFSTKKLYTGEIMHVGAAPNKENNKELVVNNPKQNLEAKYFNRNFDPPIIKMQA